MFKVRFDNVMFVLDAWWTNAKPFMKWLPKRKNKRFKFREFARNHAVVSFHEISNKVQLGSSLGTT